MPAFVSHAPRRCAALVLGAALACGLAACGASKSASAYLQEAAALHGKRENKAAIIQLKNALLLEQDNVEVRTLLAQVYADSREHRAAEIEYRRALELRPDAPPLVTGMVRALVAQREYQKALDVLDDFARRHGLLTAPMLALQGDARFGLGEKGDAEASYAAALEAEPGLAEAQLGLAGAAAASRRTDEALALVAAVLARAPGNIEALLLQGDVLRVTSRFDEAAEAYRDALARRPDETRARLRLAALYTRVDRLEAAREQIDAVKAAEPENLEADYYRAVLHIKERQYAAARDVIQHVRARSPNHLSSLQIAGVAAFYNGAVEQADRALSSYLLRAPDDAYARKLLATNSLRTGNPDKALSTISPLLRAGGGADVHAWAIAGEAALRTDQLSKADEYLQKAAALAPEDAGVRTLLGLSRLARGEGSAGIAALESAAALAGDRSRVERLLVLAHLDRGEHDRALAVVEDMRKRQPEEPSVLGLKAQVLLARGDAAAARRSLEAAIALQADHLPSLDALAALDVREQDFEAARRRFAALLKKNPNSTAAMLGLAKIAAAAGDTAQQVSWLEKASGAAPGDLEPRLLLAHHHLEHGNHRRALATAHEAYASNPDSADAMALLAHMQSKVGEKEAAATTWHMLVKAVPDSVAASYGLAMAYVELDQYAPARDALERVLELRRDHPQAQTALALLEARAGHHSAALRIAQRMRERAPKSPAGAALEGDLHMGRRDYAGAAAAYEAALQLAQTSVLFMKAHAALLRAGRLREADAKAELWVKTLPADTAARLHLAAIAMDAGRSRMAVGHYEAVLAHEPDNYVALNNLAGLRQAAKDPGALALAERAARVRPDDARIADTLGWILVERGDTRRGIEELRRGLSLDASLPVLRYHLGAAYARAGDTARARETLDALLATDDTFAERQDALTLRRRL